MTALSDSSLLLQQSSDDEDDSAESAVLAAVSGTVHRRSTSSVLTRRIMGIDFGDTSAPDADDDVNTSLTQELMQNENAPQDCFYFNYIAFYLLSMTTQLPWNFFLTAQDVSLTEGCWCEMCWRKKVIAASVADLLGDFVTSSVCFFFHLF